MRTKATELVGIDLPIFAFSHCRDVVAAVTNAGGMGVLGAVAHSPEQLAVDLDWIEAEVKGKPYGIDLLVPEKYAGSDEGGLSPKQLADLLPEEHKAFVDEILERYDVPPMPEGLEARRGVGGMRIDPKSMAPLLDVCFDHQPSLGGVRPRAAAAALPGAGPQPRHPGGRAGGQRRARPPPRRGGGRPDRGPGHRGRRPHRAGGHHGPGPRGGRRRRAPCRCWPPAASPGAASWRPAWPSAPTGSGAARSG